MAMRSQREPWRVADDLLEGKVTLGGRRSATMA